MTKLYWYTIEGDVTKQLTLAEAKKLRLCGKNVVKHKTYFGTDKKLEPTAKNISKNHHKKKTLSTEFKERTIDFDRHSSIIKGLSICHFCKADRLECRSYYFLSGKKVTVCSDCAAKRKIRSSSKNSNWKVSFDALNRSVSGSFGSGKGSR